MDVAISVSLSLLLVCGVFLTMYLIGTMSCHEDDEVENAKKSM
jgi:hypothetical protein